MPPWGWVEELLAQVIEEVSVLAADRRRKEPRQVKRPYDTTAAQPSGVVETADGGKVAYGFDAMLSVFASKAKAQAAPSDTGDQEAAGV